MNEGESSGLLCTVAQVRGNENPCNHRAEEEEEKSGREEEKSLRRRRRSEQTKPGFSLIGRHADSNEYQESVCVHGSYDDENESDGV